MIEEWDLSKCYPCRGRGKQLEKLDRDDPGAWFECACCNGTGKNLHHEKDQKTSSDMANTIRATQAQS